MQLLLIYLISERDQNIFWYIRQQRTKSVMAGSHAFEYILRMFCLLSFCVNLYDIWKVQSEWVTVFVGIKICVSWPLHEDVIPYKIPLTFSQIDNVNINVVWGEIWTDKKMFNITYTKGLYVSVWPSLYVQAIMSLI